jgi:hypothetical protein
MGYDTTTTALIGIRDIPFDRHTSICISEGTHAPTKQSTIINCGCLRVDHVHPPEIRSGGSMRTNRTTYSVGARRTEDTRMADGGDVAVVVCCRRWLLSGSLVEKYLFLYDSHERLKLISFCLFVLLGDNLVAQAWDSARCAVRIILQCSTDRS